jgi:N-acetylglutamate synthase-like GNAT family acetyltransferase
MTSNEISFRKAEPPDVIDLTSLINEAFRVAEEFFVDEERITIEGVVEHMTSGEFLLAEREGKLVGSVYLERRGDRSYLGLLSVDPTIQKGGLGSQIVFEAEAYCRNRGDKHMDISVVSLREELLPFYSKRGYEEIGTSAFPSDVKLKVPCHFINMTKAL